MHKDALADGAPPVKKGFFWKKSDPGSFTLWAEIPCDDPSSVKERYMGILEGDRWEPAFESGLTNMPLLNTPKPTPEPKVGKADELEGWKPSAKNRGAQILRIPGYDIVETGYGFEYLFVTERWTERQDASGNWTRVTKSNSKQLTGASRKRKTTSADRSKHPFAEFFTWRAAKLAGVTRGKGEKDDA